MMQGELKQKVKCNGDVHPWSHVKCANQHWNEWRKVNWMLFVDGVSCMQIGQLFYGYFMLDDLVIYLSEGAQKSVWDLSKGKNLYSNSL